MFKRREQKIEQKIEYELESNHEQSEEANETIQQKSPTAESVYITERNQDLHFPDLAKKQESSPKNFAENMLLQKLNTQRKVIYQSFSQSPSAELCEDQSVKNLALAKSTKKISLNRELKYEDCKFSFMCYKVISNL